MNTRSERAVRLDHLPDSKRHERTFGIKRDERRSAKGTVRRRANCDKNTETDLGIS